MTYVYERTGRTLLTEILAGLIVTIIAITLFLDIPQVWKLLGVVLLGIEASLVLIVSVGGHQKLRWRYQAWRRNREIHKHPELIAELERLIQKLRQVLYERRSDEPSLVMQGEEVMKALSKGELDPEYTEKVTILRDAFMQIYNRTGKSVRGRPWRSSLEFAEALREISAHLSSLNLVFATIYRHAGKYLMSSGQDRRLPQNASESWEFFRTAYNAVLQEWKTFTERFDTVIGYGTQTKAEPAKQLPAH